MRLYRRTARRIHKNGNRDGLTDRKGALEGAGKTSKREPGAQRCRKADYAGQSHHRHNRTIAPKSRRHEPT
jgi:hypothetical protein